MPMTDAAACRFMADYYGLRAADVRGLGAGEWSRAYGFVLDGREAVIRFGDHVEDFRKDQVMAAYSCAALPIPAVIDYTNRSRPHHSRRFRPHIVSSSFFWPHPAESGTSCITPGRPPFVAANGRSRWGQNFFANDLGGAGRTSNGGAGTSSQNQSGVP